MQRITGIVLVLALATGLSAQGIVQITPTKDNTLFQSTTGNLSEGAGAGIFCGVTNMSKKRRALIAFGVANHIPPGATILSASLTLEMNQTANGPLDIDLRKILADWGEGTSAPSSGNGGAGVPPTPNDATWLHRFYPSVFWATAGGDFSATASATLSVWQYAFYTWSSAQMAADVQGWVNNPATDFGWMLKCPETMVGVSKRFASKEEIFPVAWPRLTVTYLAPPSAAASNLGYGCNGAQLAAVGLPKVGNSAFALDLTGAAPGASAYVLVSSGISPASIALGGGCFFDLEPASALANFNNGVFLGPIAVDGTGHAPFPAPIPAIGALHGIVVPVQCVTVGGTLGSSNVLGLLLGT